MKFTNRWLLLCILVLILAYSNIGYAAETEDDAGKQKVIAIVFDNSTSMVRDDPVNGEKIRKSMYTTRWIEADYAVRALAAMMDAGDTLKLYLFSDSLDGDNLADIQINSTGAYEELCEKLDNMDYYGRTPYKAIQAAAHDLKKETKKECYLIVISDGNLKSDDGTGPDLTQEEVNAIFAEIMSANPSLQVKYIPIGTGDICLPGPPVELCNNSSDITQQITDAINSIYSRVAVSGIDKIDIPIKNATFFLQNDSNATSFFDNWSSDQDGYYLEGRTVINSTKKTKETKEDFDSHWKSSEEYNWNWIKTTELSGLVRKYTVSGGASNIVAIPASENLQTYYEPAVKQRITIQQNSDEPYVYDENSKQRFVEGSIHVTIEYVDMDGNALHSPTSPMLKLDEVKVTVGERELDAELDSKTGAYTFSGTLKSNDSGYLTIFNGIGLDGGKKEIELGVVGEPYVSLSATQMNKTLTLDETGSAKLYIQIRNSKGRDIFSVSEGKWKNFLPPICESKNFDVDVQNCVYCANGSMILPVTLKDPSKHQIDSQETFTFLIEREYTDDRPSEKAELTSLQVKIDSQEHTLDVEPAEFASQLNTWGVFFRGAHIPLSYICDGEILSAEQLAMAEIKLDINNSILEGKTSLKNGDVFINGVCPMMLFMNDVQSPIQITFSYTKWNRSADITKSLSLQIKAIPIILRVLLAAVIIGILVGLVCGIIWFSYGSASPKRQEYIPRKTKFTFEMVNGRRLDSDESHRVIWRGWLPFRMSHSASRYAHIKRQVENGTSFPALDLCIHREDEDTWTLVKLDKMIPELSSGNILIGGRPVSADNCRFTTGETAKDILTIKSQEAPWMWQLRIATPTKKVRGDQA